MIRQVWVFQNRMVAVFDDHGRQVPMLQGRWDEVEATLIPAIDQCHQVIEIRDALGVVWPALPNNPFCHPDCGYYCDAGKTCVCMKCYLFWHDNTYSPAAYTKEAAE
jgi:hypothetical protein